MDSEMTAEGVNVDELLGDALNETSEEGGRLPPARPATGGYRPLIDSKRKELKALQEKVLTADETGAYLKQDKNGHDYMDYFGIQKDQVRIGLLQGEINELLERERSQGEERQRRNATASRVAKALLQRELQSVDERMRKTVAEVFAQNIQNLTSNNEWMKPVYADQSKMAEAMQYIIDTAVGHATRKSWAGTTPSGEPSGEPPKREQKEDAAEEEDDFTNNLMYAYERRKRGSLTVAEAKALARAEAEKGRGA